MHADGLSRLSVLLEHILCFVLAESDPVYKLRELSTM